MCYASLERVYTDTSTYTNTHTKFINCSTFLCVYIEKVHLYSAVKVNNTLCELGICQFRCEYYMSACCVCIIIYICILCAHTSLHTFENFHTVFYSHRGSFSLRELDSASRRFQLQLLYFFMCIPL